MNAVLRIESSRGPPAPSIPPRLQDPERLREAVAQALAVWTREQGQLRAATAAAERRAAAAEVRLAVIEAHPFWRAARRLMPFVPVGPLWERTTLDGRLRRVAGPGPIRAKSVARMAFYCAASAAMSVPGAPGGFAALRQHFPRAGTWLALRYRAYRRSAWRGAADPLRADGIDAAHVTAEEQRMLRRLHTQPPAA